jgi:hypothetical protein
LDGRTSATNGHLANQTVSLIQCASRQIEFQLIELQRVIMALINDRVTPVTWDPIKRSMNIPKFK